MSQRRVGTLTRLWYRWKSLELPWRKRRLVGVDLTGTTFWELRDALGSGRMRRIAQHAAGTHHADAYVSPAWHQWLRHTRAAPPSLEEQRADVARQTQLRELARLADERWAAKPSVLDGPETRQTGPATLPRQDMGGADGAGGRRAQGGTSGSGGEEEAETQVEGEGSSKARERKDSQKARSRKNPGDEWQPDSWSPASRKR